MRRTRQGSNLYPGSFLLRWFDDQAIACRRFAVLFGIAAVFVVIAGLLMAGVINPSASSSPNNFLLGVLGVGGAFGIAFLWGECGNSGLRGMRGPDSTSGYGLYCCSSAYGTGRSRITLRSICQTGTAHSNLHPSADMSVHLRVLPMIEQGREPDILAALSPLAGFSFVRSSVWYSLFQRSLVPCYWVRALHASWSRCCWHRCPIGY